MRLHALLHRRRVRYVRFHRPFLSFLLTIVTFLLSIGVSPQLLVHATTLPPSFIETPLVSGLVNPTSFEFAPDGRVFVTEQSGTLRVIKNGVLLPTPFLSLTVDSTGERGLLGLAFDPNFATNNFLYVYYTVPGVPAHNRVSRFTANGDVVVPGSELPILDLDALSTATNHNGGAIHFAPDGTLFVGVGENANGANAQTLANRLGKILRINSDGSIPTDNPFFLTATGANRSIWAMGLRNPFTFAFQPGTGRMFINDVGENTWEEIDDGIAGSNYGWPNTEGPTNNPAFVSPLYAYNHTTGTPTGCAIIGGAFYNPTTVSFPASFVGKYFFGDLCGAWIYYIDPANPATSTQFAIGTAGFISALRVASDGSLYYVSRTTGTLYRITSALGPPPPPPPPPPPGPGNPPPAAPPAVNIADPEITKRGDQTLALPGDSVTFTLTVTNAGNSAAPNVTVSDPLPDPLIVISAAQTQGTHTTSGNTVTFAVGTVNPGQVITLTVVSRVRGNAVTPMDIINTATLSWPGGPPRSGNAIIRITRATLPSTGEHPDNASMSAWWIVSAIGAIGVGLVRHLRQKLSNRTV